MDPESVIYYEAIYLKNSNGRFLLLGEKVRMRG